MSFEERSQYCEFRVEALHRYPMCPQSVTSEVSNEVYTLSQKITFFLEWFPRNKMSKQYAENIFNQVYGGRNTQNLTYTLIPNIEITKEDLLR